MKQISRIVWGLLISFQWLPAEAGPPVPVPEQGNPNFSVSNTLIHDDNLYRLAPERSIEDASVGSDARREDYINRAALAAAVRLAAGRQFFDVVGRVEDNSYRYNDSLDYVGGAGALTWNWLIGSDWSGDVGSEYRRSLASFENNQLFKKDILTRTDYFFDVRNRVTPRWSWSGGVRSSDITHSADERESEDATIDTAKLGVRYETPIKDAFGVDYQYAEGRFPERERLGKRDEEYDQGAGILWLKYLPTVKTSLDANVGYLERDYADSGFDDYSGGTGRLKWQWFPTEKVQFGIAGWRDLRAYIDAESDYYVSRGVKVTPSWQPRDVLNIELEFSHEDQDFVGVDLPAGAQERRDTVYASQVALIYTPVPLIAIDVKYRYERRDSNQSLLDYRDKIMAVGLTFSL